MVGIWNVVRLQNDDDSEILLVANRHCRWHNLPITCVSISGVLSFTLQQRMQNRLVLISFLLSNSLLLLILEQ